MIAVLPDRSADNVLLEIGIAFGLGKSTLVLISPCRLPVPTAVAGQLYVRAEPDNANAIGFALDQLLAKGGHSTHRHVKSRSKSNERPIGREADRYLSRLEEEARSISGLQLEAAVVDALRGSGVDVVVPRVAPDENSADIAVWSDDLQPIVGNPLIIEVKANLRTKKQLVRALRQVETYRRRSNSQWALLLATTGVTLERVPIVGRVLALTVTELLEKLRVGSFSGIVRGLHNDRVHGLDR